MYISSKKNILNIGDLAMEVKHSSHRSLSDVSRPWRGRIQSNVRHRRWGLVVEIAGRLAIQNGRLKMFEEMVFYFTSFLVFWIDTNKKNNTSFFRNPFGGTGKVCCNRKKVASWWLKTSLNFHPEIWGNGSNFTSLFAERCWLCCDQLSGCLA